MKKLIFSLILVSLFSCADSNDDDSTTTDDGSTDTNSGTGIDISSVVQEFYKTDNDVTVTVDEDTETITITSNGLPDHKSPYWDVYDMEDEMYVDFGTYEISTETYDYFAAEDALMVDRLISYTDDGDTLLTFETNFNDEIVEFEFIMEIPMYPEEAEDKEETDLNEIGMALNGVAIFNNQAGDDLDIFPAALITSDEAGGHPGATSDYHYHLAGNLGIYTEDEDCSTYPTCDDSNLVGFLRDGFPLYGRQEPDGTYPDDLDDYGGHVGDTDEFDEDIYHYHTSNEDLFGMDWHVFKSGSYFGTPGDYSVEVVQGDPPTN